MLSRDASSLILRWFGAASQAVMVIVYKNRKNVKSTAKTMPGTGKRGECRGWLTAAAGALAN
jgi:hypothetical protein